MVITRQTMLGCPIKKSKMVLFIKIVKCKPKVYSHINYYYILEPKLEIALQILCKEYVKVIITSRYIIDNIFLKWYYTKEFY